MTVITSITIFIVSYILMIIAAFFLGRFIAWGVHMSIEHIWQKLSRTVKRF